MQHIQTHAMQHVKRARQLMAFGMHTTPPQSPQNQLQWWPVAEQLQYPLNVFLSQSCESSHTGDLELTLGNIYFERVRVSDEADNEGNMKLEVGGRWPIIERSGRYSNRVGQFLRFTLNADKEKEEYGSEMGEAVIEVPGFSRSNVHESQLPRSFSFSISKE